jgi:hypothetical protein
VTVLSTCRGPPHEIPRDLQNFLDLPNAGGGNIGGGRVSNGLGNAAAGFGGALAGELMDVPAASQI